MFILTLNFDSHMSEKLCYLKAYSHAFWDKYCKMYIIIIQIHLYHEVNKQLQFTQASFYWILKAKPTRNNSNYSLGRFESTK